MPHSQPLNEHFLAKIHLSVCAEAEGLTLLNFMITGLKSRLLHKDPTHPEVSLVNKI